MKSSQPIAGDFGFGIGRLRSTSQDAATLRHELYQCRGLASSVMRPRRGYGGLSGEG